MQQREGGTGLAPGAVFAEEFRIERLLGEGGMGAVYAARQLSTGKPRALKVLRQALIGDEAVRERFLREARATARVESDHVIEVIDAGFDGVSGMPWLAMELLEGETLAAVVTREGRLDRARTAEVLRQVGDGLAAAHRAGLVHRDIKPENIYLARPRRSGIAFTAKILDFGIAKLLEDVRVTGSMTVSVGSPLWMAPEQASPGSVTAATDLWPIGLLAFYLLTGRYYWKAASVPDATVTALMTEVLIKPLEPATTRAAELGVGGLLPAGFDAWLARCLEREPAARFQDAQACVTPLVSLLLGAAELVTTRPMGSAGQGVATGPGPRVSRSASSEVETIREPAASRAPVALQTVADRGAALAPTQTPAQAAALAPTQTPIPAPTQPPPSATAQGATRVTSTRTPLPTPGSTQAPPGLGTAPPAARPSRGPLFLVVGMIAATALGLGLVWSSRHSGRGREVSRVTDARAGGALPASAGGPPRARADGAAAASSIDAAAARFDAARRRAPVARRPDAGPRQPKRVRAPRATAAGGPMEAALQATIALCCRGNPGTAGPVAVEVTVGGRQTVEAVKVLAPPRGTPAADTLRRCLVVQLSERRYSAPPEPGVYGAHGRCPP